MQVGDCLHERVWVVRAHHPRTRGSWRDWRLWQLRTVLDDADSTKRSGKSSERRNVICGVGRLELGALHASDHTDQHQWPKK